jgi:hypothetical protein
MSNYCIGASVVAVRPFHAFVSLLRLDAESSDGPGFEAADTDRFVSFFAIAVGAIIDPMKRRIDLRDQLAFAGPGTKFYRTLGFKGRTVGQVGFQQTFFLQVLKCIRRLGHHLGSPAQQLLPKVLDLKGIHKFFIIRWPITWR